VLIIDDVRHPATQKKFDAVTYPVERMSRPVNYLADAVKVAEQLTFREKARAVIEAETYQTIGERLMIEAFLAGEMALVWNLKALIDVRYEQVDKQRGKSNV